jgi:hypothetical protein
VRRQWVMGIAVLAMAFAACSDLGVGEAACVTPGRDLGAAVSKANILSAQAVPTARYTPCLDKLHVGWDTVVWSAETGEAGLRILAVGAWGESRFLTARVTESCDVSDATPVESSYPDILRYEDVESQTVNVAITIVPTGELPLQRARLIVEDLAGAEIDDRPVALTIDEATEDAVLPRVNRALLRGDYVWIVDELDAEEGTVELRSNDPIAAGSGLTPDEALELIEEEVPNAFYRGEWYFTFEGGCITYEFNAEGTIAYTVAADAEDALGFFPAWRLDDIPRASG